MSAGRGCRWNALGASSLHAGARANPRTAAAGVLALLRPASACEPRPARVNTRGPCASLDAARLTEDHPGVLLPAVQTPREALQPGKTLRSK